METKTERDAIEKIYADASRIVHKWPSSQGLREHYPMLDNVAAFCSYFEREGFIVVRNAVPQSLCQAALDAFRLEVKTSREQFLRHEVMIFDEHVFTDGGFMKYPIMNIQDISDRRFGRFKQASLDVFTHVNVQRAVEALMGEPGRLVNTMFFEGNQNTWPHRDCRYIDAEEKGRLLGVVVAVEDIDPGAGRFYVCPGSNGIPVAGEEDGLAADPNSPEYKNLMKHFVTNESHECVAPVLRQGDMAIFSSRTVHGSLATADFRFSRSSFNGHWIPASQSLWLADGSSEPPEALLVNGVRVTSYGSQHSPVEKLKRRMKTHMKKMFPQSVELRRWVRRQLS